MTKTKQRKVIKGRVLRRDITESDLYKVASHTGALFLYTYGRGKNKTVMILGDPKGLRFLAKFLNDVADVNQAQIPDRSCPVGIGAHYHVYKHDGHVHPKSSDLIVGRLDGKKTGSHKWFHPLADELVASKVNDTRRVGEEGSR